MDLVKKGTQNWEELNDAASSRYIDRIDYDDIKEKLQNAEEGDFITLRRDHTRRTNVINGLLRRGLNLNKDYEVRLSESEGEPVILIVKLNMPA